MSQEKPAPQPRDLVEEFLNIQQVMMSTVFPRSLIAGILSPLEHRYVDGIRARSKSPKSAVNKVKHHKSGLWKELEEVGNFENGRYDKLAKCLGDAHGFRVVCYTKFDAFCVVRALNSDLGGDLKEAFNLFMAEDMDPYIKIKKQDHHKKNYIGYRSIHFKISVPLNWTDPYTGADVVFRFVFEIQIETANEEVWHELSHRFAYKPPPAARQNPGGTDIKERQEELKKMSESYEKLDEKLMEWLWYRNDIPACNSYYEECQKWYDNKSGFEYPEYPECELKKASSKDT